MKYARKAIALMLAVIMMAACGVSAASAASGSEKEMIGALNVSPYGLTDVEFSSSMVLDKTEASGKTYTSVASAGRAMRKAMKNRVQNIVIDIKVKDNNILSDPNGAKLMRSVYNYAIKHTGKPDEGDFLAMNVGGSLQFTGRASVSGLCTGRIVYNADYYMSASQAKEFETKLRTTLKSLNLSGKSDYQKIKKVYDWECKNIAYDSKSKGNVKYSSYAALNKKYAVCQGYASLFYRMMLELGVDARVITGYSNTQNHAWNIVKLNGRYYNCDATWDAGTNGQYRYFLKNSVAFYDHVRESKYMTPAFIREYPMSVSNYGGSMLDPFGVLATA